jgi:hypothetical protein
MAGTVVSGHATETCDAVPGLPGAHVFSGTRCSCAPPVQLRVARRRVSAVGPHDALAEPRRRRSRCSVAVLRERPLVAHDAVARRALLLGRRVTGGDRWPPSPRRSARNRMSSALRSKPLSSTWAVFLLCIMQHTQRGKPGGCLNGRRGVDVCHNNNLTIGLTGI